MISAVSEQETKLLLSSDEISKRVSQLGREITQDYKDKDLVIVGVLKGGFIFLADLIRHIKLEAEIDFIRVSSYKEGMEARDIELISDTAISLKDRHVLLVEDLIDTCRTLDFIKKTIMSKNPASFQICALIKKKKSREAKIAVNYIGFEIDDKFIIGYGTDLAEKGRNLPDIYVIE
ncbi:MAG: hypoxanthine phosphoribosyltransferase [Candidatus Dadabacteria bacterium]|nr:MAG: hypoxanthine phosphoribosyltransferase [Candidatus Dadabacteria bacterium]